MNIGINLLALLPNVSGGIEFYIRNLLASLADLDHENHYYLFTNLDNHRTLEFNQPNFHKVKVNVRARPQLRRIAWEQTYLPIAAIKYSLHVLHSPSYTWPLISSVPGVVTICDMLYKAFPECLGTCKLAFWRLFVPWSAQRCQKVLTVSERSKRDIINHLHIPPHKVIVTPLALDRALTEKGGQPTERQIEDVCRRYRIQRPYILSVGGIGKHKNALSLVKGLEILHKRPLTKDLTLVLAGNDNGAKAQIESAAVRLRLGRAVCFPGYLLRKDLPSLYAGALAYTSLSYFEGFGLTLLEAMAYMTPVVTSNQSALPEIAGAAALLVDPDDIDQFVDAVYLLASDPQYRIKFAERGIRRVKEFSWTSAARLTLAAYRQAAIKPDR